MRKWAVGQKGQPGKEGTWRDAEDDGNLSGSPIAQGAVDSVVAAHVAVPARGTSEVFYWIAAGPRWKGDWEGVDELNAKVVERGPASYMQRTRDYWSLWVNKEPIDFFDLSPDIVDLYRRSLLILRTQIDNGGAIIAANDSDITTFARDTYSYMWPRDGALVAHALDLAGYQEPPRRFFEFCADVLTPEGYLLHKYTPDRIARIVVAPVDRPQRRRRRADAAAADPGGRDRAGDLGAVEALPALPRHRGSARALRPPGQEGGGVPGQLPRRRRPSCPGRATTSGRSGAGS